MGTIAARRFDDVVGHAEIVVAIELMCAAQAVDMRAPLQPAPGTKAAWQALRSVVPALEKDRILYPDIAAATQLLRSGQLEQAVIAAILPEKLA
jgi:histidine ammonia-lyase